VAQQAERLSLRQVSPLSTARTNGIWTQLWVRCGGAAFVYHASASPSIADILLLCREPALWANCRLMHCNKQHIQKDRLATVSPKFNQTF
jgi:hypothetical protein